MRNWLEELVSANEELEAPLNFYWWSGLAAIAACTAKNTWLDRFRYILYPNVYVAVVSAGSGLRKGITISAVKSLVEKANCTRIISGTNTIEGIIQELSSQKTTKDRVFDKAQALLLSAEFENFIQKNDSALTLLTELQNTHENDEQYTKMLKSGESTLKEPCISLLVASNQTLFDSVIKAKDIQGGFIARTFIVYASQRQCINALVDPPERKLDKEWMVKRLQEISTLKGEFKWANREAKDIYKEWYHEISTRKVHDPSGTMERIGDQCLKVAMLYQLAQSNELLLTPEVIQTGINKCEETLYGLRRVVIGGQESGETSQNAAVPRIVKEFLKHPGIPLRRDQILSRTELDTLVFDRAIKNLRERNWVKDLMKDEKGRILYALEDNVLQQLLMTEAEELRRAKLTRLQ